MALKFYDGPAGQFNYDDTQFTVSSENGLLRYIGSETRGENINIPQGIKNISGMFENSILVTPPVIPNGVENMVRTFAGCRQLQHYPNMPGTVVSAYEAFAGSTFDETRNSVSADATLNYINSEMNNEIDEIVYNWQNENIWIEETFSLKGNYDKAEKKLINNELHARLAIAEARMDGLKMEENHLGMEVVRLKKMGAPSNFMEDTLRIKGLQIKNVEKEIANIKAELRYRNPTVLDILKANTVEHKQNLISIGQKITRSLIRKIDDMRQMTSNIKGNFYRATEVAQLKWDQKILEAELKINQRDIQRTAKIYNKLMPGICGASAEINHIKESLKAFKANLGHQDYQVQSGLTDLGKKFVEYMYNTMAEKTARITENEGELAKVRLRMDMISHNLSPTERRESIDIIQNISQKLGEITQSARDASQEKIASYEKISEAKENNHVTSYEKEMTAKEITDRYPAAIRNVETFSAVDYNSNVFPGKSTVKPEEQLGQYLYSEVPHVVAVYTNDERNQMIDETLNRIKTPKEERNWEAVEEKVHIKEDHAEILTASIRQDPDVSERRGNNVMDTYNGQKAVSDSQEQRASQPQRTENTSVGEGRG